MCAVVHSIEGSLLPFKIFKRYSSINAHGFGMAILEDKENKNFIFEKGLRLCENIEALYEHYKVYAEGKEHVIHFRIKSAGTISDKFCHPFLLTDNIMESMYTEGKTTKSLLFQYGTVFDSSLMQTAAVNIKNFNNAIIDKIQGSVDSSVREFFNLSYSLNYNAFSDTYLIALSLGLENHTPDEVIEILHRINKSRSARFVYLHDVEFRRVGKFLEIVPSIFVTGTGTGCS